ncbi:unnamed protein product [Fraxinus pennsylvanica]|uniref:GHMP kinase N-terminal domain-containing protein n=1 Tax=Fraxinus pennsylvanica TaxID=56036 RepID=A0AAD1Z744_9LAMI|nr:unnamed protein product [Fraxinus pennsylvanica]
MASEMEHKLWAAVADETASAVRYGFEEKLFESSLSALYYSFDGASDQSFQTRNVTVELPVLSIFCWGLAAGVIIKLGAFWLHAEHGNNTKGLKIKTWANVHRGSGLGTSSILSAAVVKGLLHAETIVMRVSPDLYWYWNSLWDGGCQDQIGGLYPRIKFTNSSFPGIPLRLQVIPLLASPQLIKEPQQRLLVFTGQVIVW